MSANRRADAVDYLPKMIDKVARATFEDEFRRMQKQLNEQASAISQQSEILKDQAEILKEQTKDLREQKTMNKSIIFGSVIVLFVSLAGLIWGAYQVVQEYNQDYLDAERYFMDKLDEFRKENYEKGNIPDTPPHPYFDISY